MNGTGNPGLACYKKFGKHRLKKAEEAVKEMFFFFRVNTSLVSTLKCTKPERQDNLRATKNL